MGRQDLSAHKSACGEVISGCSQLLFAALGPIGTTQILSAQLASWSYESKTLYE